MSKEHNDSNLGTEQINALASEIYHLLLKHKLWVDVTIYFNGMALSTEKKECGKYCYAYNSAPFILTNEDPRNHFEYVNPEHILSMSFEGPFYTVMDSMCGPVYDEFVALLESYGVHYELGNAWNLTLYKI